MGIGTHSHARTRAHSRVCGHVDGYNGGGIGEAGEMEIGAERDLEMREMSTGTKFGSVSASVSDDEMDKSSRTQDKFKQRKRDY